MLGQSILVVEDEPNIALSLKVLMTSAGYRVQVTSNGEEALNAIRAEAPDLVLLDLMMPRRNGYDLCQIIRANDAWKDMRVVILTAKGREDERRKGIAMGADDYVTKPFSTRDLVDRVRHLLDAPHG